MKIILFTEENEDYTKATVYELEPIDYPEPMIDIEGILEGEVIIDGNFEIKRVLSESAWIEEQW